MEYKDRNSYIKYRLIRFFADDLDKRELSGINKDEIITLLEKL